MMTGEAHYDILHRCWRILLADKMSDRNATAITMTFTQHKIDFEHPLPTTDMPMNEDTETVLRALAQALQQIGVFPKDANAAEAVAEMKATKYHLEDMRKLYLRDLNL